MITTFLFALAGFMLGFFLLSLGIILKRPGKHGTGQPPNDPNGKLQNIECFCGNSTHGACSGSQACEVEVFDRINDPEEIERLMRREAERA